MSPHLLDSGDPMLILKPRTRVIGLGGLPTYLRLGPPVMAGIVYPGRAGHGAGRQYLGISLDHPVVTS